MPSASPLTTITPARARSAASCSATASPYGEGRRDPTIATLGPSGGGQRPRVRRSSASGCDILEPIPERLENVPLADLLGAIEVGRGPGHPPGSMKSASGETPLLRPALQDPARGCLQPGQLSQSRGLELGVEAALASQLPRAGCDHALAHRRRAFAGRFRGQGLELDPPDADFQVDPVQQRAREPPLI